MKLVNEAIVEDYHFVVGEEYLNITKDGVEMVHISKQDAVDVVRWLNEQLIGKYYNPKETMTPIYQKHEYDKVYRPDLVGKIGHGPMYDQQSNGTNYDPGVRKAGVSEAAKEFMGRLGDPFLAQSAPSASKDGKQAILGVEVSDLAREAEKAGLPILRK